VRRVKAEAERVGLLGLDWRTLGGLPVAGASKDNAHTDRHVLRRGETGSSSEIGGTARGTRFREYCTACAILTFYLTVVPVSDFK
jgi:hypothetical protein